MLVTQYTNKVLLYFLLRGMGSIYKPLDINFSVDDKIDTKILDGQSESQK